MGAGEALQLGLAAVVERDVIAVAEGVTNGFADQDLPAIGLPGDSCRHGDVTAEQVVAAAHRSAHVDSDPNSNIVVPLALYVSV